MTIDPGSRPPDVIIIHDRDGLVELAAGSYDLAEAEFERLVGRTNSSSADPVIV